MLSFLIALVAQTATADAPPPQQRVAEQLYHATPTFSCSKSVRTRQEAAFRRRYSQRMGDLARREDALLGPDPGYIIASSYRCARVTAGSRRAFDAAMGRFDTLLTELERKVEQATVAAHPAS